MSRTVRRILIGLIPAVFVSAAILWLRAEKAAPTVTPETTDAFRSGATEDQQMVEATRGPVTATLTASPRSASSSTPIILSLEVSAPDGIDVEWPTLGSRHGLLLVRETRVHPTLPIDDVPHWRREWELATFGAGEITIPGIEVAFRDDRAPDSPIEGTLTLAAMTVERVDPDAESAAAPTEPTISDPVDVPLPIEWDRFVLPASLLGGVLLVAMIGWLLLRRPPRERAVPMRSADEIALEALHALRAEDLLARGESERFYDSLSAIVRTYVEGRFEIHAPERTTDEFLRAARQEREIEPHDRNALGAFLRAADLVKFARVQPDPDEGNEALDLAVAFVERTRRSVVPGSPAA